jgi:hypothetical protein
MHQRGGDIDGSIAIEVAGAQGMDYRFDSLLHNTLLPTVLPGVARRFVPGKPVGASLILRRGQHDIQAAIPIEIGRGHLGVGMRPLACVDVFDPAAVMVLILSPADHDVEIAVAVCQGKVEMSPPWQSRNVAFGRGLRGVRVNLRVPVKRRRALLASNPIKE